MAVGTATDREIHARTVYAVVVQVLEERGGVQVVPVHTPDVVMKDPYGSRGDHGLRHRTVDDDPLFHVVVPGVADDTALRRGLAGNYSRRRRRGDAREDRDGVPQSLPAVCKSRKVWRLTGPYRRPEHVRLDAVEHQEQYRFGGLIVIIPGQSPLILTGKQVYVRNVLTVL